MYTLKSGNLMALIGENGFIEGKSEGLYYMDTRMIGKIVPEISQRFDFLSLGEYKNDSVFFWFMAKSPSSFHDKDLLLKVEYRVDGQKLRVSYDFLNYSNEKVFLHLKNVIDYTFNDIFEIRSDKTEKREVKIERKDGEEIATYKSEYLEHKVIVKGSVSEVVIDPKDHAEISFDIFPYVKFKKKTYGTELFSIEPKKVEFNFNKKGSAMIKRAAEDVRMLLMDTKYGHFPAAGLPWFATIFGRDSIVFAIQTMDLFPELAHDILKILALTQSKKRDDEKDAVPGKIVHEIRVGEYALSGKVPFSEYYGSIDATPLFLLAVGRYQKMYGRIFDELKESIDLAAKYLDESVDSRGYLYYRSKSPNGLSNQGWKDSGDSVVFSNGKMATPPVKLVEVQAYLYEAYMTLSKFYSGELSKHFLDKAISLKKNFNEDFWMEKEKFFALAIDGNGDRVDSITSNPGHCLISGIIDDDRAYLVTKRLMDPDMFTGWGIRTMSSKMAAYNPIAYHNGSVWPHDTSIIALGMYERGFKKESIKLSKALFKSARHFNWRLPELFGGNEYLVPYPVACSPQLWSVGAEFVISKILKEGF
ncbi:amylo-alpha-1,6-glucosidase [Athalassotoga saccharophila]|uniref:amylo-alpha-1,6-glucosidase n=1 Tax=Athalassotoga saccharophila TaxID=1441386 RepID=UPI00137B58C0|nr:amylo-alpha-1,6-glucosidase [Athalassotoga saccharophila]BBJ28818.1 amylo-alpha-1,6-glucosidase [Athalassotoga saccharophila]